MLENPSDSTNDKRYAPPPQRNRVLSRRKSGGDRFERGNYSFGNDGEKSQFTSSRNVPAVEHVEAGSTNLNENPGPRLVRLDGCSTGVAAQIMNDRWAAAMHSYNDASIDLSERPVMYSGASGSAWVHTKLPPQMDFLGELRRAMRIANASGTTNAADRS